MGKRETVAFGRACCVVLLCLALLRSAAIHAQPVPTFARHQVFVERDIDGAGTDRLIFVDLLTGEQTLTPVDGERYQPFGASVLFYDRGAARVRLASPDGAVRDHMFMQPTPTTRRIDWRIAQDGEWIAWTITEGEPTSLRTVTTVAGIDGSGAQIALVDGPRDGIRAMPVAFSPDHRTLYMDYQPDTIGGLTPFQQYAGLFALDLASGTTALLPGEPGCFCGAGIDTDVFLRLALTVDLSGFDLNLFDLASGSKTTIPALGLVNYTQAGDVLIAPDGMQAVYALAQVQNFGTPTQVFRTVIVRVDLVNGTQAALTNPIVLFLRPVGWTEDASAVLLTSPTQSGTWKASLSDGRLEQVADATYVGILR